MPTTPDREKVEARVRRLGDQVTALGALKQTEGWKVLTDISERRRERYTRGLGRGLMAGREIAQRQLDYDRGFFDGARWLLAHPEKAEAEFEKALKQAEYLRALEE